MAFGLVANTSVLGAENGATTGAIDTTGANLLIVWVAAYTGNPPTLSDSKSNSWTPLTQRQGASDGFGRLYYSQGGTVGSGHTFTVATAASFSGLAVAAFSGSDATPFDVENGTSSASATSLATGNTTPTTDNQLLVTGCQTNANTDFHTAAAVTGSFTITNRQPSTAGQGYAFGLAYKIQTTAGTENPSWSWTTANDVAVASATFKSAAGGGGDLNVLIGEPQSGSSVISA